MIKHNAYERLQILYQKAMYPLSQEEKVEYEKLDEIREKGMIKAEKNAANCEWGILNGAQSYKKLETA